jgi:integrase
MSSGLTLREFYETKFRDSLLDRLSYGRVQHYDRSIAAIEKFSKFDRLLLTQVTERLLSEFVHKPIKGQGVRYHRMLAECVRIVVRTWDPTALTAPRDCQIVPPMPPANGGTVRKYAESVYIPRAMLGCTIHARENVRRAFRVLAEYSGKDVTFEELNEELVAGFFQWLLDRNHPAISINTKYRSPLFAVWRHAFRYGLLNHEPRLPKLKEEKVEPDAWTMDQMSHLMAASLDFEPGQFYHGVPRGPFWHALLRVAWWTGLRRRALFELRREDVDLATGWLSVRPSAMKTKRGKKFRLGDDAVAAIKKIWRPQRELIFPPLSMRWMDRQFDKLIGLAGIPLSKNCHNKKFHQIRRTVATQTAIAAGVEAACAVLGHSSTEMTMRYIDPTHLPGSDATAFLRPVPKEFDRDAG